MANMTTTGATGYPGTLDTRTALTDGPSGDLIVANHPNGLGAAMIAVQTTLGVNPHGSVADVATRLGVALNNNGTIRSSVIVATGSTTVGYSNGVFTLSTPENAFGNSNVGLIVSRSNNTITIYLQTRSLATPTAANPVQIPFRSSPVTTGAYDIINVTTQLSLAISSGSSVGMQANQYGRIYVGAVNNGGTAELTFHNPLQVVPATPSSYTLYRPNEAILQNTTAEGAAGTADTAAKPASTGA